MAELKPIKSFDNILLRKSGVEVIMETSGVPSLDKTGNISCYRGVNRDISERKRAESRIQHLSQQLLKAQETERQMIGSLLENRFAATHFECFVETTEHCLGSAGLTASPYGMNLSIPIYP